MKIAIIGAGKVGIALGYSLKQAGFEVVAVASRRQESLDTARRYIGSDCLYTLDLGSAVNLADTVAVTTQDREIRNVARKIFNEAKPFEGKIIFHTSGAHNASELSPLGEEGALLGSLHPLQTFPDIDAGISVLSFTPIFVEGDDSAVEVLCRLGSAIGAEVHRIKSEDKAVYHLSAVFVCNLLTALLYSGEEIIRKIGIELKTFYPIMNTTLRNIEERGPLVSLTGPVVRGDAGTVVSHLNAMKDMPLQEQVYKSLSLVAVAMAEERGTLSEDHIKLLKSLLG
jgi:predicted short-subunit dehydrogenase-like oxidoreductase (DUF2520 family)